MLTENFPVLNCTLSNFVKLQKLENALYSMDLFVLCIKRMGKRCW